MFRFILPTILIAISITGFFLFTKPTYENISSLRAQATDFNQALDNSKSLENQRDKLTQKLSQIDPSNIAKLQKMLPDNVDNIRLILEIEGIATPYGMVLKNVKYDAQTPTTTASATPTDSTVVTGGVPVTGNSDYGTWSLSFSTTSTYNNFLNFIQDLENNLRIVDVASIDFSSDDNTGQNTFSSDVYTYNIKINTYWLKN